MKVNLGNARKARIEILPLIDIVFLLLVFFIYAMLSMAVHRGVTVRLPHSSTAIVEQESLLSITIRKDGEVFLDKERVRLEDLARSLRHAAERQEASRGVLLFADKRVPYQVLVQVLDQVKTAGLSRISLQTKREQSP